MVFDGQKDNLLITKKIEDQVLINNTFPKIIINVQSPAQFLHEGFAFGGMDRMNQERSPRLWKSTKPWHDLVEQAVEKPLKGLVTICPKKGLNGQEVVGEIFGKN